MSRPAIFLDRDGVVNENRPDHVKSWSEFQFLPGVLDALRDLSKLGLPIVIVTNQSVVNRRLASHQAIDQIHRRMRDILREAGGHVTAIYACPHQPEDSCSCRKPRPGMLLKAARRFDIDLPASVMVGDAYTDVQAGSSVDCKTVLVGTGRGPETLAFLRNDSSSIRPTAIAADLPAAVPVIRSLLEPQPAPVAHAIVAPVDMQLQPNPLATR